MALKVVSSYTPMKLKVVNNYGLQGSPVNPTRVLHSNANHQTVHRTYNPQRTAPARRTQPAATAQRIQPTAAQVSAEQARRFRAEVDRKAAERAAVKKRLSDAKKAEVSTIKGGFISKLKDKASFGDLRRQRGGRELAVKYWQENEKEWGQQLVSRQRHYENKGAQLKDWVMQADSEEDYNRRVKEATTWLDAEYKAITEDIFDFQKTQMELANYAETPLSGKAATLGRFTKDMVGGVAGRSWNALTWTASQPQRAVNTVKNFVNPNNLRQYYGGDEVKDSKAIQGQGRNVVSTAWDQLRKSYNVSKDQRVVSFSKADEARRLKGKKTGFSKFSVKYGDDIVDMALDPLNFFAGAGASSKAGKTSKLSKFLDAGKKKIGDKFYSTAGKNKWLREQIIAQQFKHEVNPNRLSKWLARPEGTQLDAFFEDNKGLLDKSKQLSDEISDISSGWKSRKFKSFAGTDKGKALYNMSDEEAELLQRYANYMTYPTDGKRIVMKQQFSWDGVDLPRGLSKSRRRFIEDTARSLKRHTDWLHGKDLQNVKQRAAVLIESGNPRQVRQGQKMIKEAYGAYRKAYIPNAKRTMKAGDFVDDASDLARPQAGWFNKQQRKVSLQSSYDLFDSYKKRTAATLLNTSSEAQKLPKLQRLIDQKTKLNSVRFGRPVDEPKKWVSIKDVRKQMYKPTRKDKINEFMIRNRSKMPMGIWKKSVLKYNPAWYVNNTLWNVPASVSAAGADVFIEYGKLLTNKKYWASAVEKIPEGVLSEISREIGKGGLATKIEDTSRLATFLALKKKGFSDEKALKQVNRWLFDYHSKNWERPIKGILPFWQWQKNIVRLGTTMPFHSPRSSKVYSEGYKKFYQRPYEELPDDEQTYIDPETGKTVTYNPRKFYKGKAKIGDNFYGLPFFAVNPETALQFGMNPYMMTGADLATSSDRLGNKNTDRSAWTVLGERFPQFNLGRAQANRNNKDIDFWFSQSGNSKWAQGWDKSKSNYKLGLDNNRKFYNSLKSFVGMPRAVKFDKAEYDTKKRLTDFNKEFFSIDWAVKEDADYKAAQAEKQRLASKYGFDLQKDIYDNYWSKYDTETTTRTKKLKREAAAFNSPDTGWWKDYFALEAGSKSSASKRRPYLINKFDEWKRDHTFSKNPYYKLPKNGEINPFTLKRQESESQKRRVAGKAKYQRKLEYEKAKRTGDWSWFGKNGRSTGSRRSSPFTFDGKFFKSQESMDRYVAGAEKHKRGKLWEQYYSLKSKSARRDFLAKHPEIQMFQTPTTQAEWDALRAKIRAGRVAKTNKLSGFRASQDEIKKEINKTLPSNFGRSKRLRYKF